MEKFLDEIYQKAELYTVVNEILGLYDYGLLHRGISIFKEKKSVFQKIYDENAEVALVLEKIYKDINNRLFVSDLIKIDLLPLLDRYLRQYKCIEVDGYDGYKMESSAHGFPILKDRGQLLHSEYDPMLEARNIGLKIFEPSKTSYSLLGCGLGYIAYQLYYISGGAVKIRVFEPNEYVADYAQKYGVLSWIPEENLEIIVGRNIVPFLKSLEDEKVGYFVFRPEITRWADEVQDIISEIFINQNTRIQFKQLYEINFYQNISSKCKNIEELPAICKNNKCIVIAGGPSLDDNIEFIKKNKDSMTIISVGTTLKKLVKLGLIPDFVAVYDSTKLTMKHFEGIEEEATKLVIATCAYWEWAKRYKGDKYLVPVLDDDIQKTIWRKRSKTTSWDCGGTVTLLATKLAVYLGSQEIYLVGADFAFPRDVSHASVTPDRKKINKDDKGVIEVKAVTGENVKTIMPLNMYRKQIEEFIQSRENIIFYNMSTGGAYIKGAVDGRELLVNN